MIKTAQRKGKKVGNAFFKSSSSGLLRNSCDFSICVDKNIDKFRLKNMKDLALSKDHTKSVINNKEEE